jgi:hypothetical protein
MRFDNTCLHKFGRFIVHIRLDTRAQIFHTGKASDITALRHGNVLPLLPVVVGQIHHTNGSWRVDFVKRNLQSDTRSVSLIFADNE